MSEPHVIRLREPWERESLPDGGVRYRRFFNLPTGLTNDTTVTLVCDGLPAKAAVTLNGAKLESTPVTAVPWSHEVARLLISRNELIVDRTHASSSPDLPWRRCGWRFVRAAGPFEFAAANGQAHAKQKSC